MKAKQKETKGITYQDLFEYLDEKCNFNDGKGDKTTWVCDNKLTFTKEFCTKNKLDFEEIKVALEGSGGYCDCEVLFNSMENLDENEELPNGKNKNKK